MAVTEMAQHAHGAIVTNIEDFDALQTMVRTPVRYIPIGSNINATPFEAAGVANKRELLSLTDDNILLGYFGFLNESKGADALLQALSRLPQHIHLVFIGGRLGDSDPQNNRAFYDGLDRLVQELGITERVHWTGYVADTDVSHYLHACDLMVMPYRDGVSLRRGTLMAVLAHGRPLVSTEPQQPIDVLNHGENIWLVPRDDASALTEAVLHLLNRPSLCAEIGAGALRVSELFSWEGIAQRTGSFFEQLVE